MRVDWTINISDILLAASFLVSAIVILWKMHTRLIIIETWIQLEGSRSEKALSVLATVGEALVKVTTLYDSNKDRVDGLEARLNQHHEDLAIHVNRRNTK